MIFDVLADMAATERAFNGLPPRYYQIQRVHIAIDISRKGKIKSVLFLGEKGEGLIRPIPYLPVGVRLCADVSKSFFSGFGDLKAVGLSLDMHKGIAHPGAQAIAHLIESDCPIPEEISKGSDYIMFSLDGKIIIDEPEIIKTWQAIALDWSNSDRQGFCSVTGKYVFLQGRNQCKGKNISKEGGGVSPGLSLASADKDNAKSWDMRTGLSFASIGVDAYHDAYQVFNHITADKSRSIVVANVRWVWTGVDLNHLFMLGSEAIAPDTVLSSIFKGKTNLPDEIVAPSLFFGIQAPPSGRGRPRITPVHSTEYAEMYANVKHWFSCQGDLIRGILPILRSLFPKNSMIRGMQVYEFACAALYRKNLSRTWLEKAIIRQKLAIITNDTQLMASRIALIRLLLFHHREYMEMTSDEMLMYQWGRYYAVLREISRIASGKKEKGLSYTERLFPAWMMNPLNAYIQSMTALQRYQLDSLEGLRSILENKLMAEQPSDQQLPPKKMTREQKAAFLLGISDRDSDTFKEIQANHSKKEAGEQDNG